MILDATRSISFASLSSNCNQVPRIVCNVATLYDHRRSNNMKLKLTKTLLVLACCFICIVLLAHKTSEASRIKRQATASRARGGSSAQVSAMSMSNSRDPVSTSVMASAGGESMSSETGNTSDGEKVQDNPKVQSESTSVSTPKRKPIRKKVDRQRHDYDDREEDDRDEDYGSGYSSYDYDQFFANPMRHFRYMMNSMLDRFPIPDEADFRGGNSASASSFSSGDGSSRMSSIVRNNGQTRGIVSETRNGRTQTRRIERDGDDEDDGDLSQAASAILDHFAENDD